MNCRRLHATIPESTCIARQQANSNGLSNYGCCGRCKQGEATALAAGVVVPPSRAHFPRGYRMQLRIDAMWAERRGRQAAHP